jgi:prephenate dehydrogenase
MFSDLGHSVLVADHETELTPGDAAQVSDVTVISVPIDVTPQVIREIGPRVRSDSLLMDVTSVKSEPMQVMLESTKAGVVGTHPMFGPSVHSVQGQRVVVCRGRGDQWAEWVSSMFVARGLAVVETTAEHHDRMMATVQVLTHFQTQVHGLTLARLGAPLRESLRFTSPAYLMELYMGARHFAQSADLYGPIEMKNPATPDVTAIYLQVAREVADILASGDRDRFRAMFHEVQTFLGPFTGEALEQTSFLIDRLVERT